MKKLILIALSLFSVLAMTACKDDTEDKVELKGTFAVADITDKTAKVSLTITEEDEKVIDKEEIKITVTEKDADEATKEVSFVKGTKDYTIDGLTKLTDYVVTLTGFGDLDNKVAEKSFKTIDEVVEAPLEGTITGTMTQVATDTTITLTTDITVALTSGEFSGLEAQIMIVNMADIDLTDPDAVAPTPVEVVDYVEGTTEYVFAELTPDTTYMITFGIKQGLANVSLTVNTIIDAKTNA